MRMSAEFRLLAAAAATLGVAAGCALPLVTESEIDSQSQVAFEQMRRQGDVVKDARTRAYVNCVVNAIVRELPDDYDELEWDVEVFENDEANAFAMPGRNIGVFSGILKRMDNQDQLATVIGHEIAHVTEKHSLERANRAATANIGVSGLAILTGTGNSGAALGSLIADLGLNKPFTRGNESEADVVGLRYMAAAGFDPRQAVPFWNNMQQNEKRRPPEFMLTHPAPEKRINQLIAELPETLQIYNAARAAGKKPACGK